MRAQYLWYETVQAVACEKAECMMDAPHAQAALPTEWKEDTMNAQLLKAGCLRVCMQVLRSVFGWFHSEHAGVLAALMLASALCAAPANADDYDSIIEKNLFHDQRQKWEMEKSQGKGAASQAGLQDRGSIDKINLFGTVIKDSHSYAVMRVTQQAASSRVSRRAGRAKDRKKSGVQASQKKQDNKRPYAVGDFISGYQIVEIQSESVLLQDPYDNKRYEIFMNDGQTERTAVRTEIAEDKPEKPPRTPGKKRKPSRRSKAQSKASSKKAASTDAIRKRFERDLKLMRDDKNDAVTRQAERNWEKLEPMMPSLDEKGQEELMRLKSEFEKLRQ